MKITLPAVRADTRPALVRLLAGVALIAGIVAGMILIGLLYLIVDRLILAPVEDATVRRWGVQRG